MTKEELKKTLSDTLKEAKKQSKAILKLLKGLKKKNRGTEAYHTLLNKAAELHEAGLSAITKHRDAAKAVVTHVPAKKKAPAKKKKK